MCIRPSLTNPHHYEAMKINVGPSELLKAPSPAPQQVGTSTSLTLGDMASFFIPKDDRKENAGIKKYVFKLSAT